MLDFISHRKGLCLKISFTHYKNKIVDFNLAVDICVAVSTYLISPDKIALYVAVMGD